VVIVMLLLVVLDLRDGVAPSSGCSGRRLKGG
jgi:hypothetical protein